MIFSYLPSPVSFKPGSFLFFLNSQPIGLALFNPVCHFLIQVFITSAKGIFFLPSEKDGLVSSPMPYKPFPFNSGPSSLAWLMFRYYYNLSEPLLKGLLLVDLCPSTWVILETASLKNDWIFAQFQHML